MQAEPPISPIKKRLYEIIESGGRVQVNADLWRSSGIAKATGYRVLDELEKAELVRIFRIGPRETYVEVARHRRVPIARAAELEKLVMDSSKKAVLEDVESHCRKLCETNTTSFLCSDICRHSESVIETLNRMLQKYMELPSRLNENEILILLSAAHLHDIGYCLNVDESKDSGALKRSHTSKAYSHIMENIDTYGGPGLAPFIANVVTGHNNIPLKEGEYTDVVVGSDRIRIQFLSALLGLANELDLGARTVPKSFFEELQKGYGKIPDEAILHWMRHYYVTGINIETEIRRNAMHLKTHIHTVIPSEEYYRYFVEPQFIHPITKTILNVYFALASEGIIVDTNVGSTYTVSPHVRRIPEEMFSKYQQRILHKYSLRSLLRYDYIRTYTYLGLERSTEQYSDSNLSIRNDVSYCLLNNSDDPQWISGNGVFLQLVTELPKRKPPDRKSIEETLDFRMSVVQSDRSGEARIVFLPRQETIVEEISPQTLRYALMHRYKFSLRNTAFGLYDVVRNADRHFLKATLVYLNPIPPSTTIRLKYSWLSQALPWDFVTNTLRHYTKGLCIKFEGFPKSYQFTTSTSLLKADEMYTNEPPQLIVQYERGAVASVKTSDFLAPGTNVLVSWRDTSLSLKRARQSGLLNTSS